MRRQRYVRLMSDAAPRHDHVLVHCPRCDARATIQARNGPLRITCSACGFTKEHEQGYGLIRSVELARYNRGGTLFGARLWLETTCCGGRRLWALNERHLDYLRAFVASVDRSREFPSEPGGRQLADKLPAWLVDAKHRTEVLRALDRLHATI
jgi:ribosomal protein S27E